MGSVFGVMGEEKPKHNVLFNKSETSFQIREYDANWYYIFIFISIKIILIY